MDKGNHCHFIAKELHEQTEVLGERNIRFARRSRPRGGQLPPLSPPRLGGASAGYAEHGPSPAARRAGAQSPVTQSYPRRRKGQRSKRRLRAFLVTFPLPERTAATPSCQTLSYGKGWADHTR